jgi:hypothetical protein
MKIQELNTEKLTDTLIRDSVAYGLSIIQDEFEQVILFYAKTGKKVPDQLLTCPLCYEELHKVNNNARYLIINETVKHYNSHLTTEKLPHGIEEIKKSIADKNIQIEKTYSLRCEKHFKLCTVEGCKYHIDDDRHLTFLAKEDQEKQICQFHYWAEVIECLRNGTSAAFDSWNWKESIKIWGKEKWAEIRMEEYLLMLVKQGLIRENTNPPVIVDLDTFGLKR